MPLLPNQPWIEIPTELRVYLAFLLPAVLWFHELRDPYADWKIRRMARKITAELPEAELLKTEQDDEPHLILRRGTTDCYVCSECGLLFYLSHEQTSTMLADAFIEHARISHRWQGKFSNGVRITVPPQLRVKV